MKRKIKKFLLNLTLMINNQEQEEEKKLEKMVLVKVIGVPLKMILNKNRLKLQKHLKFRLLLKKLTIP